MQFSRICYTHAQNRGEILYRDTERDRETERENTQNAHEGEWLKLRKLGLLMERLLGILGLWLCYALLLIARERLLRIFRALCFCTTASNLEQPRNIFMNAIWLAVLCYPRMVVGLLRISLRNTCVKQRRS